MEIFAKIVWEREFIHKLMPVCIQIAHCSAIKLDPGKPSARG
jgi:hypothetical protein